MQEHVHTGFVSFMFAGISAVIFIQAMRMIAGKMIESPRLEPAGKVVGGLVNFG